jgi:radical SAM protein with 4Fe4S-binding SPASM domain
MDYGLFCSIVDQIKEFPQRLKQLALFLVGEPLLNKRLPDMIAYAKGKDIADKLFLTTNGSLLGGERSRALIDAGIDEILISVEALTEAKYRQVAATEIDYAEFVENIRELYEIRRDCNLYVKIVDTVLENGDIEKFHAIYDDICDLAYIEPVLPVFNGVEYPDAAIPKSNKLGRKVEVCCRAFFYLSVHPGGNVGCCIVDYSEKIVFGNVTESSLVDIWNNSKLDDFRCTHLKRQRQSHKICGSCYSPYYDTQASDLLDDNATELLRLFGKKGHVA